MSGGSHAYAFRRVETFAHAMRTSPNPLRRAFASHLVLVAKAMHDIEWVDSCDCSPGDENEAIRAALGEGADALQMVEIAANLRRLIKEAETLLDRHSAQPFTTEGSPT